MKKLIILSIGFAVLLFVFGNASTVEAKSYIKSYNRGGSSVRSHIRYKADGYKFNNYKYRPDRGYRR